MIKNGSANKKKCRFRIPTKYESKDERSKFRSLVLMLNWLPVPWISSITGTQLPYADAGGIEAWRMRVILTSLSANSAAIIRNYIGPLNQVLQLAFILPPK